MEPSFPVKSAQLPTQWNDNRPLKSRMFFPEFSQRAEEEQKMLFNKGQWVQQLRLKIVNDGFLPIVRAWLSYAFSITEGSESSEVPETVPVGLNATTVALFITAYWKLDRNGREEFKKFIDSARKENGCTDISYRNTPRLVEEEYNRMETKVFPKYSKNKFGVSKSKKHPSRDLAEGTKTTGGYALAKVKDTAPQKTKRTPLAENNIPINDDRSAIDIASTRKENSSPSKRKSDNLVDKHPRKKKRLEEKESNEQPSPTQPVRPANDYSNQRRRRGRANRCPPVNDADEAPETQCSAYLETFNRGGNDTETLKPLKMPSPNPAGGAVLTDARREALEMESGQLRLVTQGFAVTEILLPQPTQQPAQTPPLSPLTPCISEQSPLPTLLETSISLSLQTSTPPLLPANSPKLPSDSDGEVGPKRELPRYPPIWAKSRQEVCESTSWFRSYQGGVYFCNEIVKGYLLGGFSSTRDLFYGDGKLIVSHGGGKAESIHSSRRELETHEASDQTANDKSVKALLRNYRDNRPIVLLIDDKYTLFPFNLKAKDIAYAVLGFYTISHAWAEYQPSENGKRVVRYKFAFRWCESQGPPWWTNLDSQDSKPTSPSVEFPRRGNPKKIGVALNQGDISANTQPTCIECHQASPQVYSRDWMCLAPACRRFWTMGNGETPPVTLDYSDYFLHYRVDTHDLITLEDISPHQPDSHSPGDHTVATLALTKGWHCKACGRLSCRIKWECWECSHCDKILDIKPSLRSPDEFWDQSNGAKFRNSTIGKGSGITSLPQAVFAHGDDYCTIQTFILPDNRGKIHQIKGNEHANKQADAIFEEYQEQASAGILPFRRFPMRSHKCCSFALQSFLRLLISGLGRGSLLTNYFSQNTGEPYQYVGGGDGTIPFDKAPSAVVKARELIQDRLYAALETRHEFNEVLSAAYMTKQKMAFHSDSEKGLGPVVAGLSMGSKAFMHFRAVGRRSDRKEKVLTFVLGHGDILVMEGDGVQKYYEHTVVPVDFRIAATARFINPLQTPVIIPEL